MYQKGAQKKEIILQNAKQLFYEKGYAGATIREIGALSGDPDSLVHYYFKKKEDIIQEIYMEYTNSIDVLIYAAMPELLGDNIFLAHSINNRIYYEILLKQPNNCRVYLDILKNSSNARFIQDYAYYIYRGYAEQFQSDISDALLVALVSMTFGARREFCHDYLSGCLQIELQEGVSEILKLFPYMMRVDRDYVDEILDKSMTAFETLDYSSIKFLV